MEIEIDGKRYPLKDSDFPTIDPVNPARLTSEEQEVMDALITSFMTVSYTHLDVYKRQSWTSPALACTSGTTPCFLTR